MLEFLKAKSEPKPGSPEAMDRFWQQLRVEYGLPQKSESLTHWDVVENRKRLEREGVLFGNAADLASW
jgi:hypothetical protein